MMMNMRRSMACAAASLRTVRTSKLARPLSAVASKMSELEEYKFLLGDRGSGSLYDFKAADAKGTMVDMSAYKGKAVLIVNVASL